MIQAEDTRRLISMLETMGDGIYITKQDFTIEFMNEAMIKEFGDGTGKKCHKVICHQEKVCSWCRAEEVFKGKILHWDLYLPMADNTYDVIELPLKHADGSVSKLSIYRDITQRKKSEEKLKSSADDYKRLFDHVGVGVYISTKEGKFINANQALLNMLGYETKDKFLKINIAKDLYLRPEDRRKFQEMIERDGRVVDYEVDFKRKNGNPISVFLTANVRYDQQGNVLGYEGITVDQSQRKQMEKEIKEAYDFMDKIIRSSPNAIMATDLEGNIIIWNRAAEEILGYKAEDVVGKMNIRRIYPEDMAKDVMKMMRSPEYGGVGRLRTYPMVHVRQDGEIVEGNLSAAIIYNAQEKEIASVGIFTDLKERLEMERKLGETQEKLLQSEKLAAMGRLTSQIAHELNNPLYGIMNTLELLKTEVSPESKRRKILDMALSETVRLTDLLRKMLSFSKPDEEERQPTDINTIIEEILLLVKKQLQENSVRISSNFDKRLEKVYASRNQLRQVFLNMIANAKDAMPDGGTLTVKTKSKGKSVQIEIEDDGMGIKEENIGKMFDAFFTTKDSVKDVGLGLSVCYGFIKDHGGDIRVASKWGSGTTFTISLPVHEPESSQKAD